MIYFNPWQITSRVKMWNMLSFYGFGPLVVRGLVIFTALFAANATFTMEPAKYNFKLATLAPDRSVWIETYDAISDEILAKTNGEVKFKCYSGGIQGDEPTVIRKMRIGQLQGAGFTGTGLSQICKDSLVLQLPHVFRSYEEFDYVFRKMSPLLESQCRDNGYEVLGWPHLGFVYLFSKDVVQDIQSLRTAKPWLVENDTISKAMFEVAGITAIPAQIGDVLTGLRSGLIHTVFSPPVGMITLQWFTRVKHRLDIKGMYYFGTFVVVKKNWEGIPLEFQNEIKKICNTHFVTLNDQVRELNADALRIMGEKQVKTIPITQKGLEEFQRTSTMVADQLAGNSFAPQSLSLMQTLLSEYRKNHLANQ
jgi:TRAP-type transport system periplasmic protein